jgi:hypothetical protein
MRAEDGKVEWRGVDVAEAHFTHKQCSDAFRKEHLLVRLSMELATFRAELEPN